MSREKICAGANSRSFYKNGMKYTIDMIQLFPEATPSVKIWIKACLGFDSNPVLISSGTWNGLKYVCSDDDDPCLYGDDYEKVNSLCQEMVV